MGNVNSPVLPTCQVGGEMDSTSQRKPWGKKKKKAHTGSWNLVQRTENLRAREYGGGTNSMDTAPTVIL